MNYVDIAPYPDRPARKMLVSALPQPPDTDASNCHPSRVGDPGVLPLEKKLNFYAQNHAILCTVLQCVTDSMLLNAVNTWSAASVMLDIPRTTTSLGDGAFRRTACLEQPSSCDP